MNSKIGIVLAGVTAAALANVASAQLNYTDFSTTAGLNLVGSATVNSNTLLVTPSAPRTAGAAWSAAKQSVAGGFTSSMVVRIANGNENGLGADGLALVIQNAAPTPVGGTGGGIGYGENNKFGQAGIANSVAIEFDMWDNRIGNDWDDLSGSHVSVQSRGLQANSPDQQYSLGAANMPNLVDGRNHQLDVIYTPGVMLVYIDGVQTLQAAVNLASLLSLDNGNAWVGITAATGGSEAAQGHEVISWQFNQIPAPSSAGVLAAAGMMAARRRRSR